MALVQARMCASGCSQRARLLCALIVHAASRGVAVWLSYLRSCSILPSTSVRMSPVVCPSYITRTPAERCARVQPTAPRTQGMRKVKSHHNLGHFGHTAGAATHAPAWPTAAAASHPGGIRHSPSMPAFSALEATQTYDMSAATAADARSAHEQHRLLPNISEEDAAGLRMQEPLSSMFLDEPNVDDGDLLSLM